MKNIINRRAWLSVSAAAALSACSRSRGGGFDGYALIANSGDQSLVAVDLTEFRLTRTVALNAAPSKLVNGPVMAYALTPSNGTIHAIDRNTKVVGSRRLANYLGDLALAPDGKSLLALATHSNELIQVDLTTLAATARHKLSVKADTVDFSNSFAAVASTEGWVELIDLNSGRRNKAQTSALGTMRFRSDGKVLLAADLQNRSLLALEVPTLRTIVELPLAMQPDQLCFNSDRGQLFVSGQGMDGVAVVFPFTFEVDQTLLAGRNPGTMACSALPAYLFVASRTGSDLCILNIETRKVIGFVEMGGRPSFVTVTPDSKYALVLDQDAGDMGVIRIPTRITGEERRLKTGASLFTMISVGSKPVHAVAIPRAN